MVYIRQGIFHHGDELPAKLVHNAHLYPANNKCFTSASGTAVVNHHRRNRRLRCSCAVAAAAAAAATAATTTATAVASASCQK